MNGFNNFKHVYLRMIYESIGILKYNREEYLKFLKNSIKFKDEKIITEDKDLLIDVPDELINYCIDNKDHKINFSEIKNLMKNSKHYSNIKNFELNNELFFTIFDFNDENEINEYHVKLFKDLSSNEIDQANSDFKKYCSNIDGFCNMIDFNPINVCAINSNNKNIISTIYHELSHFIQKICNIRITASTEFNKEKINNSEKNKILRSLNLTYDNLVYYFNQNEFSTHIDDLINGLWKTYFKFYKNEIKSINQFFYMISDEFRKKENFKNSIFLQKYSLSNESNVAPLIMFAASFYFNHKYQKIKNYVEKGLIYKFNKWKNI